MRLIIKARKNLEIAEDIQDYINHKIGRFEKRLPQNAILEVELSDTRGPKKGLDKMVDLTLILPTEKNPIQFKERTENFKKSIDLLEEKLEREVEKFKEKRSYQDRGHR